MVTEQKMTLVCGGNSGARQKLLGLRANTEVVAREGGAGNV